MKKLSILFSALAVLLACAMSATVAYIYCDISWAMQYMGTSAPPSVAFLYAIPFAVGILLCVVLAIVFKKK